MSNLKEAIKKQEIKGQVLDIKPTYAMKQLMIKMKKEITSALPSYTDIDKFQEDVLNLFDSKPEFQSCEYTSLISALIKCVNLGFDIKNNLNQYKLTKCNLDGSDKVKLQITYKGLIEISHKDEKIKTLYVNEVRKNDEFDIDYGLEQKLVHKPYIKGNRGDVIGYYGVYHLKPSGYNFVFINKDELLSYSKKIGENLENDFELLSKKIVIKNLLKEAPLSKYMQNLISLDESVTSQIN